MAAVPGTASPSSAVSVSRYILLSLVLLFLAGALGQFFLAGIGVFDPAEGWANHRNLGHAVGLLTYVIWIPAVAGRAGWKLITASLLLLVLFMAQYGFVQSDEPSVEALHPLNGAVMFAISIWMTLRILDLIRGGAGGTGGAGGSVETARR